ncbi:MAG TPA: M48 family metalloprotease [Planctomycetota bacterium]|nr:M48 family metalloprotease [Planctomycetota bacterium]
MSNPFYYLAGLLLLAAYPLGSEPLAFARDRIAPWTALGGLAVYTGICWAALARRRRSAPLIRVALRLLALVLFAQLIFVFHFPLWVWTLGVEEDPLASSLLSLSPLFALNGILTLVHTHFEPRSGGLRFAFRSFLGLSFIPLFFMLFLTEIFEAVEPLARVVFVYPVVAWLIVLGSLMLLMVLLPPLLRVILGARPMEPGPLRDRLERMAESAGFSGARLSIVPTGTSRMANAFVAGLSSQWRYIFFTEAIIDGMSPESLDCVLAHEVTHAMKRHILFYLLASLAFASFSGLVHEGLDAVRVPSSVILVVMLAWAGFYWGLGFGYVSRRFETEADLVAARTVPALEGGLPPYGAARQMAAALERVADLNHASIFGWSWRHFTIARRIEILLAAEVDPSVGLAFERSCDRFRAAAIALVLGGLLCAGVNFGIQRGHADENRALLQAYDQVELGRKDLDVGNYSEALAHLRRGIDGGSASAAAWIWRADAERALNLLEDARRSEDAARKIGVSDPRLRLRLLGTP